MNRISPKEFTREIDTKDINYYIHQEKIHEIGWYVHHEVLFKVLAIVETIVDCIVDGLFTTSPQNRE